MVNKKLSGSQNKKRAADKEQKEKAVLEKTRRLDFFPGFKPKSADGGNGNENEQDHTGSGSGSGDGNCSNNNELTNSAGNLDEQVSQKADDDNTECSKYEEIPIKSAKPSDDPFFWEVNQDTIDYFLKNDFVQNIDSGFSKSTRTYGDSVNRSCTKNFFTRKLKNGEFIARENLVYSPSQGSIFCAPCLLLSKGESQFSSTNGFNDWAHANGRIEAHENSPSHRNCVIKLADGRNSSQLHIDQELESEFEKNREYWRNVMKRVVAVVKKLASRGLAFRGDDEKFGSASNGNYMMCLDLIAEFDPFLSEHIARYGTTGSGSTSYLSSTICEEVIEIMGKAVLMKLVNLVLSSKYFSVIVDSTRDLSKKDQLSLVVRYVNDEGVPEERFLCFLDNRGHTGERMAEAVLDFLKEVGLPIKDCRGQSYDTAANMSGQFKGLQARLKAANHLISYVPCAGHNANLSGSLAAKCCKMSIEYFDLLQNSYNFLSDSTDRWDVFLSFFDKDSRTLKTLSKTRWNARESACEAFARDDKVLLKTLSSLTEDETRTDIDRIKAKSYLQKVKSFDIVFMSIVWRAIFQQFGKVQHDLQSERLHVAMVVELYESLVAYFEELKASFATYFEKANEKFSELNLCEETVDNDDLDHDQNQKSDERPRRIIKKKRFFDYESEPEPAASTSDVTAASGDIDAVAEANRQASAKSNAKKSFEKILDTLIEDLTARVEAYKEFSSKFNFFVELLNLTTDQIADNVNHLCEIYDEDLEKCLFEECLHLKGYLKNLQAAGVIKTESLTLSSLYRFLVSNKRGGIYPNVFIALKIYLCVSVTNCSAERSFSALEHVHNYLRTSQEQDRMVNLAIMVIEADITISLNFEDVIEEFARVKARKKKF